MVQADPETVKGESGPLTCDNEYIAKGSEGKRGSVKWRNASVANDSDGDN